MAFGAYSTSACQTCGCSETSCESCKTVADCSNCASCCCSTTHQSWRHGRIGNGIRIEYFSSAWMTIEVLGSIGVGLIAGSFALLAFGGDSLIELISGLAVLGSLRRDSLRSSGLRTDSNRTERFTSLLLFALIPVIGSGAIYSYTTGLKPEGSPLGIAIAVGALIVMPYLYIQKKRIGRETRSLSLSMDAIESITCIFMATALLAGLLAEYFLGFWWADYLATGIILAFVAREAVESYHELHDEESAVHGQS
jgi:divalent metal cation (Fe/Co/Zn/Cd) transporter